MSSYLTSFSGKFGDLIWSMATVKQISNMVQEKVDFCCMPDCESIIPLIQMQPYIDKAFVDRNWLLHHSNHGNQPWLPQDHVELEKPYVRTYHLTYRSHPGINSEKMALIDFVAHQQGMKLLEPVCPWIDVAKYSYGEPFVAIAFNTQYEAEKKNFQNELYNRILDEITVLDVSRLMWEDAAAAIKEAVCFVGCKSANYVLAHATAQKNIFVFEPHPGRQAQGHLGVVFGNPHWPERTAPILMPIHIQAEMAASFIRTWKEEKLKEVLSHASS